MKNKMAKMAMMGYISSCLETPIFLDCTILTPILDTGEDVIFPFSKFLFSMLYVWVISYNE